MGPTDRTVWFGGIPYQEPSLAGIRLPLWLAVLAFFFFFLFPLEDFPEASQAWETLVFPLSLTEVTCCVA